MVEKVKDKSESFDPFADTRFSKNIMNSLIVIGLSGLVLSIITFISVFLVFNGGKALIEASKKIDAIGLYMELYKRFYLYWVLFINNFSKIGLAGKNYYGLKLSMASFLPTIIFVSCLIGFKVNIRNILFRYGKGEALFGDAHWATPAEIKKAGLFQKEGLLLGQYKKGKYFIGKDYQHVLLFAPTGAGKGTGFVIPNLLFWKESALVHDIKLENYEKTSGYRARVLKQKCYAWIPAAANAKSHCYNPLDWISRNPGTMVDDVQKIGNILIEKQEFWENEARALINGVILMMMADKERPKTFGEVVRILRSDDTAYLLATAMDTLGGEMHPAGYMNIAAFLQKADKEKSGVISTANSRLDLWSNPIVDKTTSRSDFDLRTFRKVCSSVYVGLTPDNVARLKPLMSMFYQQAAQFLTANMPTKDEPYGVLFMMDEFPTLGKMEQFLSGIAYFRGYHVKLFLIVQDTQQLKGVYEDAGMNSFLSNSTYRITFAANNVETSELISKLIGNKTAASVSMNRPKYLDLNPASRSVHMSKSQRALLLPQEVVTLSRELQILLVEASPPIMCKKIVYWQDDFFKKRIMKQIELPQQRIDVIGKDGKIKGKKNDVLADEIPPFKMLEGHADTKYEEEPANVKKDEEK